MSNKISQKELDEYVAHYEAVVRRTAEREKWRPAVLAMTLATAEETTREVLKRKGFSLPRRRPKKRAVA
jgi:hypothetical protein